MDAIRKKMQSLKTETETMTARADQLERESSEANKHADKLDEDIRQIQKKIGGLEIRYDEAFEKMTQAITKNEEKEKDWKQAEEEVNNLNRRMLLVEEEVKRRDTEMANQVMELCHISRTADGTARQVKVLQGKAMTNEVLLEELDKEVKEAKFMYEDSETKYVELSRRHGITEEELKRALERAEIAEANLVKVEEDLRAVGENMILLEVSEEKAIAREEKFKEQIHSLVQRLKEADKRAEYGEMNITKLNIRIDEIEDEIVREKLKLQHLSDQLSDTFEDILNKY